MPAKMRSEKHLTCSVSFPYLLIKQMPSSFFSRTVSGINRNSPSRASIKIVLPPVVPAAAESTQKKHSSQEEKLQTSSGAAVESAKGLPGT